jgi:NAD(P)-dependent dehydrogenase (short-subunit alcohol dehydrogenase family)
MSVLDRFLLTDKVAIVTGGTKGLGREMADSLAEAGAHVVVTSRTSADVDRVAKEISRSTGRDCIGVSGDIATESCAKEVVGRAVEKFGRLDIIVNNAGINVRGPIDQVTPEDFDRVMATNVRGPWLLCRSAAATFRKQNSGRVINIASTLGMVGMADRSLYCASKGAVVQLTRELAMEFAPFNVTVNAICPGPFETEMNLVLTQDPAKYQHFANYAALKRWGKMGEIGPAVLFLASEAGSYVTGAILPVDGGWTTY